MHYHDNADFPVPSRDRKAAAGERRSKTQAKNLVKAKTAREVGLRLGRKGIG
jgi:hypothetical protein